jgi:hypothetical protein
MTREVSDTLLINFKDMSTGVLGILHEEANTLIAVELHCVEHDTQNLSKS